MLKLRGLRKAPIARYRDVVAAYQTSVWLSNYCTDLEAGLLGDLNEAGLPGVRGVLPSDVPVLSIRRAHRVFADVGLLPGLRNFGVETLCNLRLDQAGEWELIAADVAARSAKGGPVWSPARRSDLRKRLQSSGVRWIWAGRWNAARRDLRDFQAAVGAYAGYLSRCAETSGRARRTVVADRYKIKAGRDVIIARDGSRVNVTTHSAQELPLVLNGVLEDVLANRKEMNSLLQLVAANQDVDVSLDQVRHAAERAARSQPVTKSRKDKVEAVAKDLSLRAGGSALATAVVEGLRQLSELS